MTSEGTDPPISKSAAKKLAAKQAKEAKKAEVQARYKTIKSSESTFTQQNLGLYT